MNLEKAFYLENNLIMPRILTQGWPYKKYQEKEVEPAENREKTLEEVNKLLTGGNNK